MSGSTSSYRDRIYIVKDIMLKLMEHNELNQTTLLSFCGLNLKKHGQSQAVSDGLWVILKPLPVGEHKIGFKGSSVDFTTGAKNTFVSDANYNIVVK